MAYPMEKNDPHSYPMEKKIATVIRWRRTIATFISDGREKNDRHIYHGQERSQTEGHAAEPATATATADLQRLRK